jgi:hypothetical protein
MTGVVVLLPPSARGVQARLGSRNPKPALLSESNMSESNRANIASNATQPTSDATPPAQINRSTAVDEQTDPKRRKPERHRWLHKAPIWIEATCALALVGITAFYTHYASIQADQATIAAKAAKSAADTADATLKEIQKGSTDTHELAVQAKNQADRTKEIADSALRQANATRALAVAAGVAAEATNMNARLAQLSERAWVGITGLELVSNHPPMPGESLPAVDEMMTIRVRFSNTGRTPALNIRVASTGFIAPVARDTNGYPFGPVFGFPRFTKSDYSIVGNIPPGSLELGRDINPWPHKITAENLKNLREDTHWAFVTGRVTYNDVSNPKVTHWFTFCYRMMPDGRAYAVYRWYNDIGDEETK